MNGRTHGLCSLLTLIRLATAARKHTHMHTCRRADCIVAFDVSLLLPMLIVIFDWIRYVLVDGDTPWYCRYEHLLCAMHRETTWTNERTHGHRCLHCALLCDWHCTCNLHTCHFHLFNRLNYILWSRKHRFQREITAAKNQCNCLTFNCNRLLYASLGHAMVIVIRIGAHWFCCLYSEHIISISLNPLVRCGNAEYARNGRTLQIPIGNRTVHFMCEFYESDVYLPWSAEVRIPIKIHREWLSAQYAPYDRLAIDVCFNLSTQSINHNSRI